MKKTDTIGDSLRAKMEREGVKREVIVGDKSPMEDEVFALHFTPGQDGLFIQGVRSDADLFVRTGSAVRYAWNGVAMNNFGELMMNLCAVSPGSRVAFLATWSEDDEFCTGVDFTTLPKDQ